MKAIDYCRALFEEHIEPAVRDSLPEVLPHLSAGVIGSGSQVLGFDDERSQDHGWGIASCKFLLPPELVVSLGSSLQKVVTEAVPESFMDLSSREHLGDNPICVTSIDAFFEEHFYGAHPPGTVPDWASADASRLHYARSGSIIHDPSGALSNRVQEFRDSYYPEDVWRWKVASSLWLVWHYGDYNSFGRLSHRGDGVGLLIGQGHCVAHSMELIVLLNREFPVYWKWLHQQYRRLPKWMDETYSFFQQLESTSDIRTRGLAIRDLCEQLRQVICEAGLVPDSSWRNYMASKDIAAQIEDEEVRQLIRDEEPRFFCW